MMELRRILGGTRRTTRIRVMALALCAPALMTACGQKGPLYLSPAPATRQATPPTPSVSPSTPSGNSSTR